MKKTLITAVALAACAGSPLLAQNVKEAVILFSLTQQKQVSVSTSKTVNNAGTWEAPPIYYKTASAKLTGTDIIRDIAIVLHGSPSYYSSKAQLVLVDSELSGFFNVSPEMADATQATIGTNAAIAVGRFDATSFAVANIGSGALETRLATGRHFEPNPNTEAWPPGHHQPWGQIFVKDPGKSGFSANNPLCENVTYFFAVTVEECYDCFYLNSFISDASFKFTQATSGGPPCCDVPENLTGSGKDRYYMTLSFDNTLNNPYLNPGFDAYVGWGQKLFPALANYNPIAGIEGLDPFPPSNAVDGLKPDFLTYESNIRSQQGKFNPYVLRFTLNGIVTYGWTLKFIDSSDVVANFIGNATYPVTGYGFAALFCSLFTGTVGINEKIVKDVNCCLNLPWYDSWYGVGWDQIGNSTDRATPINIESSLTYHTYWDEEYEPGEQFGSNPPAPTGEVD